MKWMQLWVLRWLVLSCVGLPVAFAAQGQPGVIDLGAIGQQPLLVVQQFKQLEDPTQALSLVQVQEQDLNFTAVVSKDTAPLGYGFRSSAMWLRLQFANSDDQALTRYLEVAFAGLSSVQVYVVAPGVEPTMMEAGAEVPFNTRVIANRFLVFPVVLPAKGESTVYLRVRSMKSMVVPVRLWEPQAYARYVRDDYAGQAWYFGMATAMIAFNLLLFVSLRDRIYALYVAFVVSLALSIATSGGLAKEFLWPQLVWWGEYALVFINNFTIALLLLFLRRMLNTHVLMPRADKLLLACAVLMFVVPVYCLIDYRGLVKGVVLLQLSMSVVVIGIAAASARAGQRSAWIFLLSFGALVAGAVINALMNFEMLPANWWTLNGIQIGSAIEMVVLALALADRFNQSRRETLSAQASALAAERRLVETLRTSERVLEERVLERTAELSSAVHRLKRTQVELVQAEKLASLGSLVAGIAHELNTPIGNAVTVASTMDEAARALKSDIEGAGMRKSTLVQYLDNVLPMTELVVRSCQRAAALVSSFKRVAVDQTSEQRRRFDVKDLVSDICASLRPGYKQLSWVIQEAVPDDLSCDSYPGPLGQVITNIVQNAVIHAFDGRTHGTIRITARQVDSSIELTIADDGIGMPAEVLSRIFDPFFTTRMGQGGSGLGMSISLNIVTGVLGGTLQAHSEPGLGASFVITFPQDPPQSPGPEVLESTYAGLS